MGKYGSNVSDETYVNNLYKNVLGRDADTEGLNYWVEETLVVELKPAMRHS